MKKFVCFGEVLWDDFPSGKIIGGAPLNVALRLHSLGNEAQMISRVGEDEDGEQIIEYIEKRGLSSKLIQNDAEHNTGLVKVELDEKGSPTYKIVFPSAWDFISETTDNAIAVKNADAFIYGSLAARNQDTAKTLKKLIEISSYRVFDVNLRAPFYTYELLKELMLSSDFLKLNDEELELISEHFQSPSNNLEEQINWLAEFSQTSQICVTLGSKGAVLYINGTFYYQNGIPITVVDTVGAGDSFLASLLSKWLNGAKPEDALLYACAMGSAVAASKGANPNITDEQINNLLKL